MASKTTGIDAVIAEASSVIKNFSEQEKVLARQWCYRAIQKIGLGKLDIKFSDPLYLSDWSATKPTDMSKLIDLALFDSADAEIVIKYKGRGQNISSAWVTATTYALTDIVLQSGTRYECIIAHDSGTFSDDLTNLKWSVLESLSRIHGDSRPYIEALQVTEDDTYFNVEEFDDDSPTGAYFICRYYAFQTDSDGYPKIPETHVLAVIMYIRYMFTMRNDKGLGAEQIARESWLREAAAAYGRIKTPTMLEGKELARTINSMIQKTVPRLRQF